MQQQAFNKLVSIGHIAAFENYISNGMVITAFEPSPDNNWLVGIVNTLGQMDATRRASLIVTTPMIGTLPAAYVFGPDDWTSPEQLVAIDQSLLSVVIDTDEIEWEQDYWFGITVVTGDYGAVPVVAVYGGVSNVLLGAVAALRVDDETWLKIVAFRLTQQMQGQR